MARALWQVNQRRAGIKGLGDAPHAATDAGSLHAFTFSEFLESLVVTSLRRKPHPKTLLASDHVCPTVQNFVERVVLSRVRHDDVKGFREGVLASTMLNAELDGAAQMLRSLHAGYAPAARPLQARGSGGPFFRFAARAVAAEDKSIVLRSAGPSKGGGAQLPLAAFSEMCWEAGLVGSYTSWARVKQSFVQALEPGDALADLGEFREAVTRLAHAITPMTREERVGAPPPPIRKKKLAGRVLLELEEGCCMMKFTSDAEAKLTAKLCLVLGKLATVATQQLDLEG